MYPIIQNLINNWQKVHIICFLVYGGGRWFCANVSRVVVREQFDCHEPSVAGCASVDYTGAAQ